jgi:hypothetical protein
MPAHDFGEDVPALPTYGARLVYMQMHALSDWRDSMSTLEAIRQVLLHPMLASASALVVPDAADMSQPCPGTGLALTHKPGVMQDTLQVRPAPPHHAHRPNNLRSLTTPGPSTSDGMRGS